MTIGIWIADISGIVTIISVIVPAIIRFAIKPVVRDMLDQQNKEVTKIIDDRITRHEQYFHRRQGTYDSQRNR